MSTTEKVIKFKFIHRSNDHLNHDHVIHSVFIASFCVYFSSTQYVYL